MGVPWRRAYCLNYSLDAALFIRMVRLRAEGYAVGCWLHKNV